MPKWKLQFASPRVAMAGREFWGSGSQFSPLLFSTEKPLTLPVTSPQEVQLPQHVFQSPQYGSRCERDTNPRSLLNGEEQSSQSKNDVGSTRALLSVRIQRSPGTCVIQAILTISSTKTLKSVFLIFTLKNETSPKKVSELSKFSFNCSWALY